MKLKKQKIRGSVLLETIIATAIFSMLSVVIISTMIQIRENQYNSYLYNQASQLVQEWMEALISIKWVSSDTGSWESQNGFDTFTAGTHYLIKNLDDNWELTIVTPEVINWRFNRSILIEDVIRLDDGKGDIDTTWTGTGEALLPSGQVSKKVTVQVDWLNLYNETKQIELTTYLINWGNPLIFSN